MCDCKSKCEKCGFTAHYEAESAGPLTFSIALTDEQMATIKRQWAEKYPHCRSLANVLFPPPPPFGPTEFKDAEPGPLAGWAVSVSFDGADLTDDKDAER